MFAGFIVCQLRLTVLFMEQQVVSCRVERKAKVSDDFFLFLMCPCYSMFRDTGNMSRNVHMQYLSDYIRNWLPICNTHVHHINCIISYPTPSFLVSHVFIHLKVFLFFMEGNYLD